jgi:hypothetical protein
MDYLIVLPPELGVAPAEAEERLRAGLNEEAPEEPETAEEGPPSG